MTININNKEIELKYSIRALMMYENITGNSFNPSNITDMLTFFYCIIISSSKDYSYSFDNFIDDLDKDPSMLESMTKWMQGNNNTHDTLKKN